MFNSEFYPTPPALIEKMLEPYKSKPFKGGYDENLNNSFNLRNKTILEPSAGKGDILDYITGKYILSKTPCKYRTGEFDTQHTQNSANINKIYCCEINPELKYILQEKGHRVIADNFLDYNGDYLFDMIIMNPPFSNGDEHLLKAWDIIEEGEIICILNAETILNPYSTKRKLLIKLIDTYGSYEILESEFKNAERKTNVKVAIVRLKKISTRKKLDFEFENEKESKIILNEDTFKDPVATLDVTGNMILQYGKVKEAFVAYMKAKEALNFYGQQLTVQGASISAIAEETFKDKSDTKNQVYNNFCDSMKQQIWTVMMSKTNVEKYMTNNVRQNFQNFSKSQGYMDFTKKNVGSMVQFIFENRVNIMEQAIVCVFDIFTRYHDENRLHIEGWKTNDKFKVNKKVILPYFVSFSFGENYDIEHRRWDEYSDIDKVMCYLSGTPFEDFSTVIGEYNSYSTRNRDKNYKRLSLKNAIEKIKIGDSSLHVSEFFFIRCYKKGTLHITFKDERLWQEFNVNACAGKNWLPEADRKEYDKRKKRSQESNWKPTLSLQQ